METKWDKNNQSILSNDRVGYTTLDCGRSDKKTVLCVCV